jgi:UDP-N-acetylmuramate--alanine ligase
LKRKEENIYLIGIGGIGMSALARYFHQIGKQVAGYDRAITKLTRLLQAEGIAVNHILEADAIPFPFRDKENTLVIYTPAIAVNNPILQYFKEEGFHCKKRAEVLGSISKGLRTIAVAGTHGKTTVSSMIAYLLQAAGMKINAFLGGISHDFGTNLLLNPDAEYMVTEADEYDRSFLQLFPSIAIVTSMDADHLDVYKEADELKKSYQTFCGQIDEDGILFTKEKLVEELLPSSKLNVKLYGTNESDIKITALKVVNGHFQFNLAYGTHHLKAISCGLPGLHNVENASVAIALCLELGVSPDIVKSAIASYRGVQRRFDVHLKQSKLVYIDDYAHHPQEIKALIESVKELYPNKKITAVFQPHLYSRTKDFGAEFAEELAQVDELILLELYPAREDPIEGIDSRWLAKQVPKENVHVLQKSQLIKHLEGLEMEVLLTIGAGDIDTLVEPLIQHFEQ